MSKKTVLVTGIGGNVGQGIIRNIRASNFAINIVGINIKNFSAGNHLCDVFYKVPYAYKTNYISEVESIVKKECVDLIIPSTDFEVYYLSKYQKKISCKIVVSTLETTSNYLDKYKTFLHFKKHVIPFAASFLPSTYYNEFHSFILKPRKGRGSRGIQINPISYKSFSDDEYMIQEFHEGVEITTAFYVNKSRKLHGFITFERFLENGTTTHCKVITSLNKRIEDILLKIISSSDIKGSANLQAIVTKEGRIIPFEINCRISGTNSIRANFGFKDVEYTLQEWLYNETPKKPITKIGIATRILMDVIYEDVQNFDEAKNNSAKHFIY